MKSLDFTVQPLLVAVARSIRMVVFATVGELLSIYWVSSKPLATKQAFIPSSLRVMTHLVDMQG